MKHLFTTISSRVLFLYAIVISLFTITAQSQTVFTEDWESGIGTWYADNGLWEVGIPIVGPVSTHSGVNCA